MLFHSFIHVYSESQDWKGDSGDDEDEMNEGRKQKGRDNEEAEGEEGDQRRKEEKGREKNEEEERHKEKHEEKQDEKARLDTFKDQLEKLQIKKLEENANADAEKRSRTGEVWSADVNKREKLAFEAAWIRAMAYVKDRNRIPSLFMSTVEMETA